MEFRLKLYKVLKRMVGPCGLEPQTSTVSKRRDYVPPITYSPLKAALVRVNTAKMEFLQVKLQVRTSRRCPVGSVITPKSARSTVSVRLTHLFREQCLW